jgi:hypothetical protein
MNSKRLRSTRRGNLRKIIIGSLLIASSITGVWLTLEANSRTEEFLVAANATSGGAVVSDSDFRVANLNLADSANLYLRPGDVPAGSYLLYSADAGQLVPKTWVASAIIDQREPVVISSTMPLPSTVKVGDLVNIWVSKKQDAGKYLAPVQLVLNAEIAELTEATGMLADQAPRVQVLVPVESVGSILDAIASKDALSLVLQRNLSNE